MTHMTLEERVATLESQLAELRSAKGKNRTKDWRRTIGMFAGDEVMKRIYRSALEFREADRARARRRHSKPKQTKK